MRCRICDSDNATWDVTDWYCQECIDWFWLQQTEWEIEEELEGLEIEDTPNLS